jgi:HEAT repeat protein
MPLIRKDAIATGQSGAAPIDTRRAIDLLRSGTADERRSAARAISDLVHAGASGDARISDGTKALGEAIKTEMDLRVREAIFTSLVRVGGGESVDVVVSCLRTDDAQLRTGALDAMRAMMGAVRPVLPDLLADLDTDIRILTCDLVRELPAADATRLLCEVLARETNANVCAAAVDVLADIGEAGALPFLQACSGRFADVTFLTFAISFAMERIVADRSVQNE